MSASSAIVSAFHRWRMTELAMHFAAPCPDDVMNALSDQNDIAIRALAAQPATSVDDLLLKLLPLALIENSPPIGGWPMQPVNEPVSGSNYQEDALWRSIIVDLPEVMPLLAEVMCPGSPVIGP